MAASSVSGVSHTEALCDPEEGEGKGDKGTESTIRCLPRFTALCASSAGSPQVCAHTRDGPCPQLPLASDGVFPMDSALVQGIIS